MTFDKRVRDAKSSDIYWSVALVALPVLIVVALIGVAVNHPSAGQWIAQSAQAEYVGTEFVGTDLVPDVAPPTRIARPGHGVLVAIPN